MAVSGLLAGPTGPQGPGPTFPASPAAASGIPNAASASPDASAAAPTGGTKNGLIAVVDANGSLTTMDDRGGSIVSYAVAGVAFGFPTWSPDGSRIAAVGSTATDASIYVFRVPRGTTAGTAGPVVIYRSPNRPPFYLYWTPDGRKVAFLATESAGISLRIAPADGTAPLDGSAKGALIRQGAPLYFAWEDASRLLIHVGTGTSGFVGEVGLDGTSLTPTLAGTGDFRAASASHDGRYFAFARATTGSSGEIVVAAQDGASRHALPVFGPAAFVFDPAGDALAAIGATTPGAPASGFPVGPLRLIDPGSGAARTLVDGLVVAFFWAPDGRTIAALRLASPGGQNARVDGTLAAAGIGSIAAATPAPAAEVRLAFIDVATGAVRSEQVVQPAVGFVDRVLPYFDQYALSHRVWAPDSTSVVLPLADGTGRTHVVVVPADGSDARTIANGEAAFWSP